MGKKHRDEWLDVPRNDRIRIAIEEADEDMSDAMWLQWVADFAKVKVDDVTEYLRTHSKELPDA